METRVERINPCLEVQDLAAAIRYYVDLLGFELYVQTPSLAILACDGHQIHLRQGGPHSATARIWIGVEDIAVLYALYSQRGVKIAQEPANYSWAYQMVIEDLDGNLLVFGSEPLEGKRLEDEA